jgi:CheY-like chemotaxis protein
MKTDPHYPFILMADDDPDDFFLTQLALDESGAQIELHRVPDGKVLLDYLLNERFPLPSLILLDLNMPCIDGKQVLSVLKADRNLRHIPVVVYTSSTSRDDVVRCYQLGASTYIPKPASFQSLVKSMKTLYTYWLDVAALPYQSQRHPWEWGRW